VFRRFFNVRQNNDLYFLIKMIENDHFLRKKEYRRWKVKRSSFRERNIFKNVHILIGTISDKAAAKGRNTGRRNDLHI